MEPVRQARETLFAGRRIHVVRDVYLTTAGQTYVRELVLTRGAVVMLPLFPDEQICLIRNYRDAVGQELWELPAGTLEPGEMPDQAAARELEEEIGYRARSWRKLLEFYPSPGILSECMHLYVAWDMEKTVQRLDEGERITPEIVPFAEALRWIENGRIRDGKTIVGLLYWEWHRTQTEDS